MEKKMFIGGKEMPPRKIAKKKAKKKKTTPLLGVAPGQEGLMRIGASTLRVTRTPDRVVLARMPKKQRFIRE